MLIFLNGKTNLLISQWFMKWFRLDPGFVAWGNKEYYHCLHWLHFFLGGGGGQNFSLQNSGISPTDISIRTTLYSVWCDRKPVPLSSFLLLVAHKGFIHRFKRYYCSTAFTWVPSPHSAAVKVRANLYNKMNSTTWKVLLRTFIGIFYNGHIPGFHLYP